MNVPNIELKDIIKNNYMHTGSFTLSSGKKSSRYFDIKAMLGDSVHSSLLMFALADLIESNFREDEIGSIGGIELGGALIAAAFPFSKNTCFIRKNGRDHGMNKVIEGKPKNPVLLIDDVITSGKTIYGALGACSEANLKIAGIICVINRGWFTSKDESIQDHNYVPSQKVKIHSLFKESDFD